jgi:hypothetical protein
MKISKKIERYLNEFETKERNEETIVVFKTNASQELTDSVHKAHGDRLPNDWIYDKYESILSTLSGYDINDIDDVEDNRHEIVDGLVDIYNSDLTSWLGSSYDNSYYVDEAKKEFGTSDEIYKDIAMGQYMAIDEIYSEVVNLLSE